MVNTCEHCGTAPKSLLKHEEDGWWHGGVPPFGFDLAYFAPGGAHRYTVRYQPDGTKLVTMAYGGHRTLARGDQMRRGAQEKCRLVPGAPERMQLVHDLFAWYTREGLGVRQIVDRLNRQHLSAPRAGTWSAMHCHDGWSIHTIRGILQNPAYTLGPEPLIDPHTFALAQQLRLERAETPSGRVGAIRGRGANSPYLLSGLLTCAQCGKAWRGRPPKAGAKNQTVYYACATYTTEGNAACPKWLVPQPELESKVLACISADMIAVRTEDLEEEVLIRLAEAEITDAGINLSLQGIIDEAIAGRLPTLMATWPMAAQRSLVRAFVAQLLLDPEEQQAQIIMRDLI